MVKTASENISEKATAVKRMPASELVKVFALLLCMVNCVIVVVLLTKLDPAFNGNIFIFEGLQNYLNLSFVLLALPVVSSGIAMVVLFMKKAGPPSSETLIKAEPEVELQAIPSIEEELLKQRDFEDYGIPEAIKEEPYESESLIQENEKTVISDKLSITCPNCGKIVNRPSVKLDFTGGKAMLEDVCPYCNYVLGESTFEETST